MDVGGEGWRMRLRDRRRVVENEVVENEVVRLAARTGKIDDEDWKDRQRGLESDLEQLS